MVWRKFYIKYFSIWMCKWKLQGKWRESIFIFMNFIKYKLQDFWLSPEVLLAWTRKNCCTLRIVFYTWASLEGPISNGCVVWLNDNSLIFRSYSTDSLVLCMNNLVQSCKRRLKPLPANELLWILQVKLLLKWIDGLAWLTVWIDQAYYVARQYVSRDYKSICSYICFIAVS